MTIEYFPKALEWIIPTANTKKERQLRNRDAQASCTTCSANLESDVMEAYQFAIEHDKNNPAHIIQLIEDSCGSTVIR
jgi:hypothetical protein